MHKSIFNYLESISLPVQSLNFRFPIETLDGLLRKFYKDYEKSAFLVQANKLVNNLNLRKISDSYLLRVPLSDESNEHLYIGISDLLSFLVIFDEPAPEEQNLKEQKSRFFLTFDKSIITTVFDFFYKNYCKTLSVREKKLLIKLKNAPIAELDPFYISKFQEALLINALSDNNKIKQAKIIEAFSFTDESVVITDLAGNIKEYNQSFEKCFGKNKAKINEILPLAIAEESIKGISKKTGWQSEIEIKTLNESSALMLVGCNFFRDELQRPNGFIYTFKNITELKKLDHLNRQLIAKLRERNVQLSEVNKRLLEADKIKTDLLSVVSHELKTPVSSIIGFSELIAHREYDEKTVKDFAEQITDSARQLDRVITDYLEVAGNHFGASNDKLHTMPVNLTELVRYCFREQELKFNEIKFNMDVNCLGYEPIIISETQNLQKLFGNLLNNSMKFSPDGGNISVKILNDRENVTISIADRGIGLTFNQAKHVFEPFYRVDNSVTRKFSGIGLGLAVCKKIVEIYNGSIWCEPGVDSGTVFYVTLPVNPNKPKATEKPVLSPVQTESTETREKLRIEAE
ncbi:MAG: hypothetical protein A3B68_06795 [Candidatus Melainabacteria bacterium RIFCSPHIGHO2_02_FULL_34_12]|nr:MAG: hypothetical protein A3B68_06795 [Candidatus Melainabacteria bacterium RIFCSPHIGHO2_02_FULL_34_12]